MKCSHTSITTALFCVLASFAQQTEAFQVDTTCSVGHMSTKCRPGTALHLRRLFKNRRKITTIDSLDEYLEFTNRDDDKLTVVKFYASWCKSCAQFDLRYKKLAKKESSGVDCDGNRTSGRVQFAEVEFGANEEMVREMGIQKLPYIHMYKGKAGKVASFLSGPKRFQQVIDKVEEFADMSAEEILFKQQLEKGESLISDLPISTQRAQNATAVF